MLAEEPAQAWAKLQVEDTRGRRPEQVPFGNYKYVLMQGSVMQTSINDAVHIKCAAARDLCTAQAVVPSLGLKEGKLPYD